MSDQAPSDPQAAPPVSASESPDPARRPRRRRLRRAALALGGVLLVLFAGVLLVLSSLDHPVVRAQVRERVRRATGIDLDYEGLSLRLFSGLRLRGLHVRAPAPYDQLGKDLLSVGAIEVDWELSRALHGQVPVRQLTVRDVAVTLVLDDDGKSSLDGLSPQPAPPPQKVEPTPRSQMLRPLVDLPLAPVGVTLDGCTVVVVRRAHGLVTDRVTLTGLRAEAALRGESLARLHVGPAGRPAELLAVVTQAQGPAQGQSRQAAVRFGLDIEAKNAASVDAAVELRLLRQDLEPRLPPLEQILSIAAHADLQPDPGRIAVRLTRLSALDGALRAEAQAELPDRDAEPPLLRTASGQVDLLAVFARLPASVAQVQAREGALRFAASSLELGAPPRFLPGGKLSLDGRIAGLALLQGGLRVALAEADVHAEGGFAAGANPGGGKTWAKLLLPLRGLIQRDGTGAEVLALKSVDLAVEASRDAAPGSAVHLIVKLPLTGLVAQAGARVEADEARLDLDATARGQSDVSGRLGLTLGSLSAAVPGKQPARLGLRGTRLDLRLDDLHLDSAAPLRSTGGVALTGRIAALTAGQGKARLLADGMGLDLSTRLLGHGPYALTARLPIAHVAAWEGRRPLLPRTPGRLDLKVTEVTPDADHPARSRAGLAFTLDLGDNHVQATVRKGADRADFQIEARSPNLALLRAALPEDLTAKHEVPWERMSLLLTSQGTAQGLSSSSPSIDHKTLLKLGQPGWRAGSQRASAAAVQIDLSSRGNARRHDGTLDLRLSELRLGERRVGDGHTSLSLNLDRDRPRLSLRLRGDGEAAPGGEGTVELSFDRRAGQLAYRIDLDLQRLGVIDVLLPFLPRDRHRVDYGALKLTAHMKGQLGGVVRDITPAGAVRMWPHPEETLRGTSDIDLRLSGLRYQGLGQASGPNAGSGAMRVDVPDLKLTAALKADEGAAKSAQVSLDLARLHLVLDEREDDVEGLTGALKLSQKGDLQEGALAIDLSLRARAVRDKALSFYPIGDLTLTLLVDKTEEGAIRITKFVFDNPRGGTYLTLRGGGDLTRPAAGRGVGAAVLPGLKERLIYGRESMAITGTLRQRLDALAKNPAELAASGQVSADLLLESADLALFHAAVLLRLDNVSVDAHPQGLQRLGPKGRERETGWALKNAYGRIPIVQDVLVTSGGATVLQDATRNPYSRLRFTDQHPFLNSSEGGAGDPERLALTNYLAVESVRLGDLRLGPLGGNLRIDRNLISLDQLDTALRGGQVRGRLLVDYRGDDSVIEFYGSGTGIRPTGGEKDELDANAALRFGLRRRDLAGRIELLRLSRRHLLDLIGVIDPYQEDTSMNRVRMALRAGYPEQVSLAFEQGFTSLDIRLGGLVSFVRINKITGIPTGPILERYLEESLTPLTAGPEKTP